jgi:hypothetical protein
MCKTALVPAVTSPTEVSVSRSPLLRRSALVAAATGAALCAAPAAHAAQLSLGYQCKYPLIGEQPLVVNIDAPLPTHLDAGEQSPAFTINASATAGGVAYQGLSMVGAASIEGNAVAKASISVPGATTLPLAIKMAVGKYAVPATPPAGGMTLAATGAAPTLSFDEDGLAAVAVDSLRLNLTARDASGAPITALSTLQTIPATDTDAATFDVACTLDPATQSTTLGQIAVGTAEPVTPAPATTAPMPATKSTTANMNYVLGGTSEMRTTTKGIVPVSGKISTTIDLATGKYVGNMSLDTVTAPLVSGGLNVRVTNAYESVGQVTGTLINGNLTSVSRATIHVRSVLLGKTGNVDLLRTAKDCHTETPSVFDLKSSTPFSPLKGGSVSGQFAISPLVDCGALGGIVSKRTAGSGNLINMSLTPDFASTMQGTGTTPIATSTPAPVATPTPTPTAAPCTYATRRTCARR